MPANNQTERTRTQKAAQFQKGKSGNPAGRKPDTDEAKQEKRDAAELAKCYTVEAVQALVKVVRTVDDPKHNAAAVVNAANSLLNRGWGQPKQTLDVDVNHKQDWSALLTALDKRNAELSLAEAETVPLIEVIDVTPLGIDAQLK
jgi:hypothetical protein